MTPDFLTVANDSISLTLWPDCGGRLISLKVEGSEVLWRNPDFFNPLGELARPKATWPPLDETMGSWSNVGGSKTWPAPQGWSGPDQWPGPPDEILDSGRWAAEQIATPQGTQVTLTSPADPRSGLQVTRSFTIPPHGSTFTQVNTFTNVSTDTIRWSIWEVCQVDTESSINGGEIQVSVSDETPPKLMIDAFGETPSGTLSGGQRTIPVPNAVGKLGFANATGSVQLTRPDGTSVRLQFQPAEGAEYPDNGSRVELWLQCPLDQPLEQFGGLHPRAYLAELEVLGPLQTLQPDEGTSLEIEWQLTGPTAS